MRPAARSRPILHTDWSISLGENRPDQRSPSSGSYAVHIRNSADTYETFVDRYKYLRNEISYEVPGSSFHTAFKH